MEGSILEYIPPYVREKLSPEAWTNLFLQHREDLTKVGRDILEGMFLQIVQTNPMFGSHWFHVYKLDESKTPLKFQQLPRELLLAFNSQGMQIHNMSGNLLIKYAYIDIARWGEAAPSNFELF